MPTTVQILAPEEWLPLQAAHQAAVDERVGDHLARAHRHVPHPVEDFLFTYYSLTPGRLRRWHPGWRLALTGSAAQERLSWRGYARVPGSVAVAADLADLVRRRGAALSGIRALVAATAGRPASFGCFGLHEWAMVYRQEPGDQRHRQLPLRLGQAGTDAVVDAHLLRCTHFDAYRFFTGPATPRNASALTSAQRPMQEQPGCLHAGMDVYKWAFQLLPVTSSALVLAAFDLARQIRTLDMQASPYDLSQLGMEPVRIETPEGRAEYAQRQRAFSTQAQALRARLLTELPPLPESH